MNTVKHLIFTDLDGTLLDHDSYTFDAALPALNALSKRAIPVIPVTSKTCSEILDLRRVLKNTHPFVVENGAAIFIPIKYFEDDSGLSEKIPGYLCKAFSPERDYWTAFLEKISKEFPGEFTYFSKMGVEGIVKMTGLSPEQAEYANKRNYSEPVFWTGSQESRINFIDEVSKHGFTELLSVAVATNGDANGYRPFP